MSWGLLEAALRKVSSGGSFKLAPGATPEALDALEGVIGRKLPDSFRRTWSEHSGFRPEPFSLLELLGARAMASEWLGLRDYDGLSGEAETIGPVKALWTNRAWIPFVLIGGETRHLCLDLDPAPGGRVGQVIHATPKWEQRRVIAPGVDELLALLASAVAEGRYQLDGDSLDVCDALGI